MAINAAWGGAMTWDDLSPRQRDIMLGVARGHTNQQIADEHGLSAKTVKNIVASVYDKLYFSNRVEATLWVLAHEDLAIDILASI